MVKKGTLKTLAVVAGVGTAIYIATQVRAAPPDEPEPGLANLYGKVTNAQTGGAVSGAILALNGLSVTTDTGGNYAFTNLEPGSYSGSASKEPEYETYYF